MPDQKKSKTGQNKDTEGLSRREALEATLNKAAYIAPVAVLLLSKPARAGVTVVCSNCN